MQTLKVEITKARISSFGVTLKEGQPDVTASIDLLTDGGKEITSYQISTSAWNDVNKFDLPKGMIIPICAIAEELEKIVTKHCESNILALTEAKQ